MLPLVASGSGRLADIKQSKRSNYIDSLFLNDFAAEIETLSSLGQCKSHLNILETNNPTSAMPALNISLHSEDPHLRILKQQKSRFTLTHFCRHFSTSSTPRFRDAHCTTTHPMAKRLKNQFRRERQKLRKLADAGAAADTSKSAPPEEPPAESTVKSPKLSAPLPEPVTDEPVKVNGASSKEHESPGLTDKEQHLDEKLSPLPLPSAQTSTADAPEDSDSDSSRDQRTRLFESLQSKETKSSESAPEAAPLEGVSQPSEDTHTSNPDLLQQFAGVFRRFGEKQTPRIPQSVIVRPDTSLSESDSELDTEQAPVSKRQRRKAEKVPISALKSYARRPQAVEWYDADAPDPYLAVAMKTALNHVDVPQHWQQKKDYLSLKRGVERHSYVLPPYIARTGIAEMRNHDVESLKKLQRDRVQPKMGKLDIDYQKLHDAFFKHQTKPRLLAFGELFAEGGEKADKTRSAVASLRPGKVSRALRLAVGMLENENQVPPWVTVMGDIGKPPSYADLLIPGLDIEYSNSGYKRQTDSEIPLLDMRGPTWGAMEEGESEEEEEEEEEESESEQENVGNPQDSEVVFDDAETKVELTEYSRVKTQAQPKTETSGPLYRVLKEKSAESGGLMGNTAAYEIEESGTTELKIEKIFNV